MIKITNRGVRYQSGAFVPADNTDGYKKTIAYGILKAHNTLATTAKNKPLAIRFDALASHDITYVNIIQTAKAIGLEKFPMPYVLTNCHNSLCAVGGTINEDDHIFGLSAAKKYGGIYVPPHVAVIHTYMREMMAGCGKMILGSDSHTRYGALGTMAVGEGGPELVKQIIGDTYNVKYPDVVAVYLTGKLRKGVGPQDVAIALVKAVFAEGIVKNKVLEFFGDGVATLSAETRNGIDVMTTETTCLSSIWATDSTIKAYLKAFGRENDFKKLAPKNGAYYDALIEINLSEVEPMIALPFHPSNAYTIKELLANPKEILKKVEEDGRKTLNNPNFTLSTKITPDGRIKVDQAVIAGCAGGTYENIYAAGEILKGKATGDFPLNIYCGSQPVYLDLMKKGALTKLTEAGAIIKTSFCGPCFGAGDVPSNGALSIRHTTRNFPSREGSKPSDGQVASVALMDARSIAATAMNGGYLTSALDLDYDDAVKKFNFDSSVYNSRVYNGYGKGDAGSELVYGPNIADFPEQYALADNLVMKMVTVINDAVTTTDELIPSGETSSYRSNPIKLASFTLSRKAPYHVGRAKAVLAEEEERRKSGKLPEEYAKAIELAGGIKGSVAIGSAIFAVKPGDGSAREQAASCQRFLGGVANIAREYATKRYRSNLINWGMLPFISKDGVFEEGDIVVIKNPKSCLKGSDIEAIIVRNGTATKTTLNVGSLGDAEQDIIKAGCLINYNRQIAGEKK